MKRSADSKRICLKTGMSRADYITVIGAGLAGLAGRGSRGSCEAV